VRRRRVVVDCLHLVGDSLGLKLLTQGTFVVDLFGRCCEIISSPSFPRSLLEVLSSSHL
jgi:hypothetical protein